MKRSDQPSKQPTPFSVNGVRESILSQTPSGSARASYDKGFPPITMTPKASGGLPPKGPDMNQILYELSSLGRWESCGALQRYDADFAESIAGYPAGCVLISDDGLKSFISMTDDNQNNPNTNMTGWKDFGEFLGIDNSLRTDLASNLSGKGASLVKLLSGRNVQQKTTDILSGPDYGAVSNGTTDNSTPFANLAAQINSNGGGLANLPGSNYKVNTSPWSNNISELLIRSNSPSTLGVFEGSASSPNSLNKGPTLWVQKHTSLDNPGDRFAHNIGSVFGETVYYGSGNNTSQNEGTWISGLFNSITKGVNRGTTSSPYWDAVGNVVGLAGFAESTGAPGNGNIITALWGYAATPTIDDTTFSNIPASENWSTVGLEINLAINHKDVGSKSTVSGPGVTVGNLLFNYRTTNSGVKDWTFGMALNGSPNDGDYTNLNVSNWNGFHSGILIDKIKNQGILFGKYMASGSYGIQFPSTYADMAQRPAAAIFMGDTVMNWGTYLGTTWNDGDMWRNGTTLYYRKGSVNTQGVFSEAVTASTTSTVTSKIKVTINGTVYYLLASTSST